MRLTDSEREALAQRLEDWFGDFRQSFLVSHLQPVIEQIVTARLAEAEFHIQQLTRARDLREAAEEGTNGRLGDRAVVDALLACLPMHEDGTGHVADCGYDWDATTRCGCYTLPDRLAAIVREHTERAWDEGKRAAYYAERDDRDGSEIPNPYRAAQREAS